MILFHFPDSSLIAQIKSYDIILMYDCKGKENILRFRDECIRELHRRYDLHKKKPI